jgi:hypothetical protein
MFLPYAYPSLYFSLPPLSRRADSSLSHPVSALLTPVIKTKPNQTKQPTTILLYSKPTAYQ